MLARQVKHDDPGSITYQHGGLRPERSRTRPAATGQRLPPAAGIDLLRDRRRMVYEPYRGRATNRTTARRTLEQGPHPVDQHADLGSADAGRRLRRIHRRTPIGLLANFTLYNLRPGFLKARSGTVYPNIEYPALANRLHTRLDWDYATEQNRVDGVHCSSRSNSAADSMRTQCYVTSSSSTYPERRERGLGTSITSLHLRSRGRAHGAWEPRLRWRAARLRSALATTSASPRPRGERDNRDPRIEDDYSAEQDASAIQVGAGGKRWSAAKPSCAPALRAPESRGAHQRPRARPQGRRRRRRAGFATRAPGEQRSAHAAK